MVDLAALLAFNPSPRAVRVARAKPKPRVYVRGTRPRGFMALSAEDQQITALDKYKTLYRLYCQWTHNFKKSKGVSQKGWAAAEIEEIERKLTYWSRFITTRDGITKMERMTSRIKYNWRFE